MRLWMRWSLINQKQNRTGWTSLCLIMSKIKKHCLKNQNQKQIQTTIWWWDKLWGFQWGEVWSTRSRIGQRRRFSACSCQETLFDIWRIRNKSNNLMMRQDLRLSMWWSLINKKKNWTASPFLGLFMSRNAVLRIRNKSKQQSDDERISEAFNEVMFDQQAPESQFTLFSRSLWIELAFGSLFRCF